jgi:predicted DNA-binding transcriptional regulator YafY
LRRKARNIAIRYITIIDMLKSAKAIKADHFAHELKVSTRTIARDISELVLMYPIASTREGYEWVGRRGNDR